MYKGSRPEFEKSSIPSQSEQDLLARLADAEKRALQAERDLALERARIAEARVRELEKTIAEIQRSNSSSQSAPRPTYSAQWDFFS
ncbi:hypothetical protein BN59_03799 [Legionella massiliensis]|uniref:Uncharacterized protein n=1 Tax=Legionella massiliensis TaxID=1034943 RepID=A0A078L2T1_9GAMM|nr:hypothetical protein [Legionella massiliensis]CDZ79481.1 hypothetical protein BN59_03799 [Legionella massiliensis]CEE15219.1 hypothetical protein BN1094_03799 [Legionella massiliensis]